MNAAATAFSPAPASEGLAFIQPLCIGMQVDGRDLMITPLVMSELPQVLAQALPVLASLKTTGPGFFERLMAKRLEVDEVAGLLTSFAVNGEQYIALVAICCRQPAEWVGNLLLDRVVDLFFAVLEVNADFFRRALPLIAMVAARAQAGAAARQEGQTPEQEQEPGSATPTPSPSS